MSVNLISQEGSKNANLIGTLHHLSKQQKENSTGDKFVPEFSNIQSLNTIETFINYSIYSIFPILILLIVIFIIFIIIKYFSK